MSTTDPKVTGSPESIWLIYGEIDTDTAHDECHEIGWCDEPLDSADVRYVRGDVVDRLRAERDAARAEVDTLEAELEEWRFTNAVDVLCRERDELAAKYDELLVALHGIGSALGIEEAERSPYSITCGVLAMAKRLAEIERAEPAAWIEHELQGTGLRYLHFERRPNTLRDDVVAPIWTELIARPTPTKHVSAADELAPAAARKGGAK